MSYLSWWKQHEKKHRELLTKLRAKKMSKEHIIEYFKFENMVQNEQDFCPLYAQNKKCHDVAYLNCYFCACPNFRFNDNGIEKEATKTQYSFCAIDSKDGSLAEYAGALHQDCSSCLVPHTKKYVTQHFNYSWKEVMQHSLLSDKDL